MLKASADKNSGNGKKAAASGSGKDNIHPIPEDEADLVLISQPPRDLNNFDITNKVLVGRICTIKTLNKSTIRSAFARMWEPYPNVYVSEISHYTYSFTFEQESQAENALEKSPWFISNCLLSLQRWGSAKTCYEVCFNKVPFWIQIHDLPLASFSVDSISEDGTDRTGGRLGQRLDQASESELILTWNHRLSLKRNRVPGVSLDEVEEELVRRKKMKKESWYDQDGNLICVNVSSIHGNQTFMVEEEGVLMPLSK